MFVLVVAWDEGVNPLTMVSSRRVLCDGVRSLYKAASMGESFMKFDKNNAVKWYSRVLGLRGEAVVFVLVVA